tara:strand:- start:241 stop:474 length:234 start_codon:yes stop_codon:yes gene_type:complete
MTEEKNMAGIYCPIPDGGKRWKILESIEHKTWNELSKKEDEIATKIYLGECICKEENPNHNTSIGLGWYTIYPEGGA